MNKKFYVESRENPFDGTINFSGKFLTQSDFDKFFNRTKISQFNSKSFDDAVNERQLSRNLILKINMMLEGLTKETVNKIPFDVENLKKEASELISILELDESTVA